MPPVWLKSIWRLGPVRLKNCQPDADQCRPQCEGWGVRNPGPEPPTPAPLVPSAPCEALLEVVGNFGILTPD
jgi:hypothetical protein